MTRSQLPRILPLVLVALLLLGTGCQSPPAEAPAPTVVGPQLFDCREDDDEPAECRHVWQQVDVHAYTRMLNGIPSVELCSVLQCNKCRQVRHECRPPPRR